MNSAIVLKEALRVGCLSSLYVNKRQVTGEICIPYWRRKSFWEYLPFYFLKGHCSFKSVKGSY